MAIYENGAKILSILQEHYGERDALKLMGVYAAFSDYIESSPDFEVFCSEKLGHIFCLYLAGKIDEIDLKIIEDSDDFFEFLIKEIIKDVMGLKLNGEHFSNRLAQIEIDEVHKRVKPYLDKFSEIGREKRTAQFEEIMEDWMDV